MKNVAGWLLAIFAVAANSSNSAAAPVSFERPRGIYLLGSLEQPLPVASVMEKHFVDGFTARVEWETFEPSRGEYDFSQLDATLAALAPYGGSKRLTLEIFAREVPPYVLAEPGVVTYQGTGTGQASSTIITLPVPWDEFTVTRWEALVTALAAHRAPDPATGTEVPLSAHSLLAQIDAPLPGLGGIRDLGNKLVQSPNYDRALFLGCIKRGVNIVEDRFPNASPFMLYFSMNDGQSPPLNPLILESVRSEFFPGGRAPRLGLFKENWTCSQPLAVAGDALAGSQSETYILLQAKQAWTGPFLDPPSTDECLVFDPPLADGWQTGDQRVDNATRRTAVSGPEVGMRYAMDTFQAMYFEVYLPDLQQASFDDDFQAMHDLIWADPAVATTDAWTVY